MIEQEYFIRNANPDEFEISQQSLKPNFWLRFLLGVK